MDFFSKCVKLLGHFSKSQGKAARIFQAAWKFYKNFPCRVPELSMFFLKNSLRALMLHVKSSCSFDQVMLSISKCFNPSSFIPQIKVKQNNRARTMMLLCGRDLAKSNKHYYFQSARFPFKEKCPTIAVIFFWSARFPFKEKCPTISVTFF